jgi:hypothetical protein
MEVSLEQTQGHYFTLAVLNIRILSPEPANSILCLHFCLTDRAEDLVDKLRTISECLNVLRPILLSLPAGM